MALTDKLTAIANAIRGKTGKTEPLTLDAMPGEIEGISTGGVSEQELLESYVASEWPSGDIVVNYSGNIGNKFAVTPITSFYGPNVKAMNNGAFTTCKRLKFAILPLLTAVTNNGFSGCIALEKLDILGGDKIHNYGLDGCKNLSVLILRSNTLTALNSQLSSITNTPLAGYDGRKGIVYVPSALIEEYKQATNWSYYYELGTLSFLPIEGSEYE